MMRGEEKGEKAWFEAPSRQHCPETVLGRRESQNKHFQLEESQIGINVQRLVLLTGSASDSK
jgi:hypothetical protein